MKQCPICGKKSQKAWRLVKLRGKYNPTTKRRQVPNLQWAKIPLDIKKQEFKPFAGKRVKICTQCLKTLGKIS